MYRSILKIALIVLAGAAVLVSIRIFLVEPDEMARQCIADYTTYLCRLRKATINGFAQHLFGEISLAAALLAAIGALRYFALIAMLSGLAGVILYDFEWSAVGLLLGALVFARLDYKRHQDGERKKRAPYTPA